MNQWLNYLKRDTGSNLANQGRDAAHVGGERCCRRLRRDLMQSVVRPRGRFAGYPWRCCKGES